MRQVWSLTKLVVRESVRKRLFVILGIAALIIPLGPLMVPASGTRGKIEIAESWLLSCVSFFGFVIILFLAGTSLPRDIRKGRLTTLLTKPVSRSRVILSKFLGFSLVVGIFIAGAGVVGYVVLAGIEYRSGASLLNTHRLLEADQFQFLPKEDVNQSIYRGETKATSRGEDVISIYGTGTTTPFALWTFQPPASGRYLDVPRLSFEFRGRGARDQFNVTGRVFVEVQRKTGTDEQGEPTFEWVQVRRKIMDFRQNRTRHMSLVPEETFFLEDGGTLFDTVDRFRVSLALANPAGRIRFSDHSVKLQGPPGSYLLNYCKALFLLFLLLLIVTGFMMAVTPLVSAPISICLGLLFYGVGLSRPFLQDAVRVTQSVLHHRHAAGGAPAGPHAPSMNMPTWLLEYSRFVTENLLMVIPQYELFSPGGTLVGQQISSAVLLQGVRQTLLYVAVFLILGMIVFQLKELKS